MKKISLNEELLHQIRLMNFDRSKTLLEHDPEDNPNWYTMNPELSNTPKGSTDAVFDSSRSPRPKCNNVDQFRKSYPYCCKYPELAKYKKFSDENELPFQNGVGWCYYRDARDADMFIQADAELTFSNESFFDSFTEKLLELLDSDYKLFYQTIWNSVTFRRLIQSLESSYPDFKTRKNIALATYIRQRIEQILPKGSIIRFNINEGLYDFNTVVEIDEITSDIMFNWYYDQQGKQYQQPESVDTRTDYQKFIDDWGMWLQLAAMVAASILLPGLGQIGLMLEIGVELGTGLILAQRDFEKGDNIMGMINILAGGLSSLKFIPYFRGINPAVAKRAAEAMRKANLSSKTTPKEYEKFIKFLMRKDPEAAQVLNKMAHVDDYTKNLIKSELPKRIEKETIDGLKNYIVKNPKKLGDIKFWEKLWVLDLKRQLGTMGVGLALDFSPLGKILNNEEKQKYKWVYDKIPDYSKRDYDFNAANNPEIQKEIINSQTNNFLNKCKSLTKEDHQRALLLLQKQYIINNGGEYRPTGNPKEFSSSDLLKKGYTEINENEIDKLSNEELEGFEITSDNKYFYKIKSNKEESNLDIKSQTPNNPEENK